MSQKTKWTLGPWVNDDGLVCGRDAHGGISDDIFVAVPIIEYDASGAPHFQHDEWQANAHLIASAPGLYVELEKCKAALIEIKRHTMGVATEEAITAIENIDAALARARGES